MLDQMHHVMSPENQDEDVLVDEGPKQSENLTDRVMYYNKNLVVLRIPVRSPAEMETRDQAGPDPTSSIPQEQRGCEETRQEDKR